MISLCNFYYPPILFNNLPFKRVQFHRHLGLTLDSQLNFDEHFSSTLSIVNKLTVALRKLQTVLPRYSLLKLYKVFIRPHLDYWDVIYDKTFNEPWHKKLEFAQYNVALAITGVSYIWGTNTVNLYLELGLESLQNRRKLRSCFTKSIMTNLHCNFITWFLQKHRQRKSYNKGETLILWKFFFPCNHNWMEWLRLFFAQCSFHQYFQDKYFKSLFALVLIKFLIFTTRMV